MSICLYKQMDDKKFQKIAKALADRRRFEIFEMLAAKDDNGMCGGAVCDEFPVSQATVSHHLKELTEADLLVPRSEGQFKFWSVNQETMNDYIAELQNRLGLTETIGKK